MTYAQIMSDVCVNRSVSLGQSAEIERLGWAAALLASRLGQDRILAHPDELRTITQSLSEPLRTVWEFAGALCYGYGCSVAVAAGAPRGR